MSDVTSQVRYDAHPSMLRMRPFTTLMVFALMLAGILLAVLGTGFLPAALSEQAARLDARVVQVVGIAIFALAAMQVLAWWVSARMDTLKITDDEVLWTHGLVNKQYTEISMGSVRTVRVSQSLFQRLMNAGDITVFTSGDLPELVVRGLPDPGRVRELVKVRAGATAEA